jgi:acyl-coenzyme A thioesterase PaaI-like protein
MTGFTAQMATDFVHGAVPAIGRLGVVVEAISPGSVDLRVPIEGNANHMGTMYAGALFALAELPGGLIPLAAFEPGRYTPIVTGVEIRFVAAARTDVTLSARMDPGDLRALGEQVDAEGLAHFTLDLVGRDAEGRTVITSTGHYQLRPNRG